MPEGDTIHRAAARINAALAGRVIELADAPNPRSPIHNRAGELQGQTLEQAEAFGKHLVAHFSGGQALHSHLGMNGKWFVTADGRLPYGKPWLRLASGRGIASQTGGKLLRIVSESRARNDPGLLRLGPDPLRAGFEVEAAAERLRRLGAGARSATRCSTRRSSAGSATRSGSRRCFRPGSAPGAGSRSSATPSSRRWSRRAGG